MKQSHKVYILVGRNFFSWDKIFVFYWSTLSYCYLLHWNNFELDLDEQHPFVDRNYYKNSCLNDFLSAGKLKMKNYKNVFEFSQRRRPFLKNLYSYWIHSIGQFPGIDRIHSSKKKFPKKEIFEGNSKKWKIINTIYKWMI